MRTPCLRLVAALVLALVLAPATALAAASHARARAASRPSPPSADVAVATNPRTGVEFVFWRSPSGTIFESWYRTSWHGPVALQFSARSTPSVAINAAGQQFLAWEGAGGHILQATYRRRWSGPQDLTATHRWGATGLTTGPPSIVVSPRSDRPALFWRDPAGNVEEAIDAGGWHFADTPHWSSASAPSAATTQGRLSVFWTTDRGDIVESDNAGRWTGPFDLNQELHWRAGARASSAPGVAINPVTGARFVFWRASGGQIDEAYHTTGWHGPLSLGWQSASAPTAAVLGDGGQDVLWSLGGRIDEATPGAGAVGRWGLQPGAGAYAEVTETTPDLADKLTPMSDVQFGHPSTGHIATINVDDRTRYQRIDGVGAAMTDTSAWLIGQQLSSQARLALMRNLFTIAGAHLDFTLIPMGGTDFTANGVPYSYDDLPAGQSDPALARFSIAHDEGYILPLLRQMLQLAPATRTFAVPWSPPGWMKSNDLLSDLRHGGVLLPQAYGSLAGYFVRFLQAYAAQGVPIDAISPENEPRSAAAYPAMSFPAADEDQWIAQDLVPALRAARLDPGIYGNDTSWKLDDYAQATVAGPERPLLNGLAWHCYGGIPSAMNDLHQLAHNLDQIVTECAPNLSHFAVPEIVIGSLRNWASTVTLWNLATDPTGGPVQQPNTGCNGCRGVVTISEASHQVTYNHDYYQLGQLGRFTERGALRIASNTFVRFARTTTAYGATEGIDDVALLNPDGSRVLMAYNNSGTTRRIAVRWRRAAFRYTLSPGATVTFRWNP